MTQATLKRALKEAFVEAMQEHRELISGAMLEAMEELALARAIREGQKSKRVRRDRVMLALRGHRR